MKKIAMLVVFILTGGMTASAATIGGSVSQNQGPDGYNDTRISAKININDISINPTWTRYSSDDLNNGNLFGLRLAKENRLYSAGISAGMTPKYTVFDDVDLKYAKYYGGVDFTFSLRPNDGEKLVGPSAGTVTHGGNGIAGIDVGAGVRYIKNDFTSSRTASDSDSNQIEENVYAGVLFGPLLFTGTYSHYDYVGDGRDDAKAGVTLTPIFISGLNMIASGGPLKDNISIRADVPLPMVTPFIGYTKTNYYGSEETGGDEDSNSYLLGAYVDLNMVYVNVSYQIFNMDSHNKGITSIGAGIKF